MIRSILIGLDGSDDGQAAVDLGLSWAKEFDAQAVGVSVVDESGIHVSEQSMFATGYQQAITEPLVEVARHRSSVILEQFSTRCHDLRINFKAVNDSGTPYVHLIEEAKRCDLVVLGQRTHYEYGWKEEPDETLGRVLRDSSRPVVVVPRLVEGGEDVVVAYDESLQSARAIAGFESSGLARSRTVHVIAVNADQTEAARLARHAAEFLRKHDVHAVERPVESSRDPAEVILEEARKLQAGLLVIGAYGQPTMKEFFLGSVTRTILERASMPVFCSH